MSGELEEDYRRITGDALARDHWQALEDLRAARASAPPPPLWEATHAIIAPG